MNLRQSLSYPELIVGDDGAIYYNGKRLSHIKDHGYANKGPMVYYWHEGRVRHVSVMRLVYEAHIKKSLLTKGDYIDCIDGDENNTHASNLENGLRKPSPKRKARPSEKEPYSTWMNGESELFC